MLLISGFRISVCAVTLIISTKIVFQSLLERLSPLANFHEVINE